MFKSNLQACIKENVWVYIHIRIYSLLKKSTTFIQLCDMHGLVVAQGVFMYVDECNLKSKVWKTI